MASTTERKLVVRGRPTPAGSGISGSSTAHSASVVSLAKRSPARRYCARVISVQDMVLSIESSQIDGITSRWNHSLLFGQPLRSAALQGPCVSKDGRGQRAYLCHPSRRTRVDARVLLRMRSEILAAAYPIRP